MTQLHPTLTTTNSITATNVLPLDYKSSPKMISLRDKTQGFKIAPDSEIHPLELLSFGFSIKNGEFFPADIEEVQRRFENLFMTGIIEKSFAILDLSTDSQKIFSFDNCPF